MTEAHAQILVDILPLLVPEMILAGVACIVFLGGTVRADRHLWGAVTLAGFAAAQVALHFSAEPTLAAAAPLSPVLFDPLTNLLRGFGFLTGILFTLLSWNEVDDRRAADWHACLLILVAGIGLTAAANDLVLMFLVLELISIPTYVMLYVPREDALMQEAALKYFLLSVFSSALVLFGFSYLYGMTGETNLTRILQALNSPELTASDTPLLATVALVTIVAGLGFRLKAAPFHFYAPDVFQGGPVVMSALLAWVHKATGFIALLRILGYVLPPNVPSRHLLGAGLSEQTPILLWFLAAITMTWGNVLGLAQVNVKRLFAYSTIAHAGYMLVALSTASYLRSDPGGADGIEALLFYLVAYGVTTVGAFAVIAYLSTPERPVDTIDDLAGLSRSHPALALMMAIFLFSLIGIPLTAGFTGKFLVFFGAMAVEGDHAHLYWILALIGVVNAAIGGWYYLRLIAVMYLRQPLQPLTPRPNLPGLATLIVCAVLTVGFGVPPGSNWLMKHVQEAAGTVHERPGPRAEMAR
jgi:NADH-quinone oxidoreductase subunit N